MKMLFHDRRLFIGVLGIIMIALLSLRAPGTNLTEFVYGIVAIVGAISGTNMWQKIKTHSSTSQTSIQSPKEISSDTEAVDGKRKRK